MGILKEIYELLKGITLNPKGDLEKSNEIFKQIYPIAFGLPATVPIPVRSGPQGSVTILYCAWSFVTKKSSKTKRNAGLFLDFFSTPFGI